MPRPRFLRMPADRRLRLLDEAAREFGRHGFERASLNRILEAAGVSKGAAYYYFENKADLFAAVVDHYWEEVQQESGLDLAALTAATFWDRLATFGETAMRRAVSTPWMNGVARAIWTLPPRARSEGRLKDIFARTQSFLAGLLQRGRELGVVRADVPMDLQMAMVLAIDQASDRWMADHLPGMEPADIETLFRALFQAIRRLLEPEVAR